MSTAVSGARRLVAFALTDADVLLAGSDLRHVSDAATEVDILVARHDPPGPPAGGSPMDAEDYPDDDGLDVEGGVVTGAGTGDDGAPGPATPADGDAPAGPRLHRLHRLGLRWAVQDRDEPDLVAAMCELVGFDPDDQVFLLAPAVGADAVTDPEVAVALRAVRRVARVYGLPVLQYRRAGAGPGPAVELPAPPVACGG